MDAREEIGLHVAPFIIRCGCAVDGQPCFVLVAQNFHQDVFLRWVAIEHELDVAGHGEDAVILPSALVKLTEIVDAHAQVVEVHETGKRHNHGVVAIA